MKLAILERHLFELRYGYIAEKEPMSNHINLNTVKTEYYHQFSAKSFGELFGYREYKRFIDLIDYVNAPVNTMDDLLAGVSEGEMKAAKEKEEAKKRAIAKASRDPQMKREINNLIEGQS